MSYARTLAKLSAFQQTSFDTLPYGNDAGTFTNARQAMDWVFAVLYPNTQDSVDTPSDLPASGNTLNDYRVVIDDGDGKAAGYRWEAREGEVSPSWHKIHDMDWSSDSILAAFQDVAQDLYVHKNGRMDLDGNGNPLTGTFAGQTIYGGSTSGNLTLNANAGDGTGSQTGYVQVAGNTRPTSDNAYNLGTATERFADIFMAGSLRDGVLTLSLQDLKGAYDHALITSGNPHNTGYDDLSTKLETLTVDGDASGSVDLSTAGNKTLTITVADDSHDHTTSTITDFATASYTKIKNTIQDGTGITWTANDGLETYTPAISVTTGQITDVASPVVDTLLASNPAGTEWTAVTPQVELTGEVTGTGSYSSTTGKFSVSTTLATPPKMRSLQDVTFSNKAISSIITGATTVLNIPNHGMNSFEKLRIFGSVTTPSINNIAYEVTVLDFNTVTIPVSTSSVTAPGYYVPDYAQFLYNANTDKFEIYKEYEQIRLGELAGLNEDVLSIYVAKNGRTGGQVVIGGLSASEDLTLESTANATKGLVKSKDTLAPFTTASYSGTWSGASLGSSSLKWNDLYMSGEAKGFRAENVGSLPVPSGTEIGRVVFYNNTLWVNTGAAYVQAGSGGESAVAAKSAHYSMAVDDGVILASNTITITLPDVGTLTSVKRYTIKNVGTGTITLSGFGSQTIDGSLTVDLENTNQAISVVPSGSSWYIV